MRHQLNTEIKIEAPPETVWQILTDLGGYPDWNPFIVSAKGSVVVGERLTNRMAPPGGKQMTFKPTATVVDEHKTFEWLGRLGLPGIFDGRHRFVLNQTDDGGTHLAHSEQFSGVLVRMFRKSLDTQTKQGFERMNHALKQRSEQLVESLRTAE